MQGFGTNERELIRVLADKDPLQVNMIRDAFSTQIGRGSRNLIEDLRKETSSWFQYGLIALARGPLLNDVYMLRDAIQGMGTNEALLNDVVLSRSNADLNAIKDMYARTFGISLAADVAGDLSLMTKRHFDMITSAQRAEESAPVMPDRTQADVDTLYTATEGKIGTDEVRVMEIFTYRNDNQLRAISQAYQAKYRRPLCDVIRKVSTISGFLISMFGILSFVTDTSLAGILRPHARRTSQSTSPLRRPIYACRRTAGRVHARPWH